MKVRVDCPIVRSNHSHVSIVLDLPLGAPGFDFCKEVSLKLSVDWRAVFSLFAVLLWLTF